MNFLKISQFEDEKINYYVTRWRAIITYMLYTLPQDELIKILKNIVICIFLKSYKYNQVISNYVIRITIMIKDVIILEIIMKHIKSLT